MFQHCFFPQNTNNMIASRKQLPLRLCYGMTINKAIGLTIPEVTVDVATIFKPGMLGKF